MVHPWAHPVTLRALRNEESCLKPSLEVLHGGSTGDQHADGTIYSLNRNRHRSSVVFHARADVEPTFPIASGDEPQGVGHSSWLLAKRPSMEVFLNP